MVHLQFGMSDIAGRVKQWQADKFDAIIVFDGKRGLGKSTGALKLARLFPQFKMKKDIVFSQQEIMDHLMKKKEEVILADEMIAAMYNRDFFAENQKKILKMLNMYRDSFNVLIACVPNFADLDKQFRNLVKLRINVVKRGMAIIHTQNITTYSTDPWDIKLNEKIEQGWAKRAVAKPQYHRLTTFRGILKYGPLGAKIERDYLKIKAHKRNVVVEEEGSKKDAKTPKQQMLDHLYKLVKEGKLDRRKLQEVVLCNPLLVHHNVVNGLSNRARNEGTTLRALFTTPQRGEEKQLTTQMTRSGGISPEIG